MRAQENRETLGVVAEEGGLNARETGRVRSEFSMNLKDPLPYRTRHCLGRQGARFPARSNVGTPSTTLSGGGKGARMRRGGAASKKKQPV